MKLAHYKIVKLIKTKKLFNLSTRAECSEFVASGVVPFFFLCFGRYYVCRMLSSDTRSASSSFEQVLQSCAALDLGAGVKQSFDCLIVQNHQAVQSSGRSVG